MRRRRRALAAVALVVCGLLAVVATAHAGPADPGTDEATLVARANRERAGRRLAGLRVAADLVAVARRHAQEMAASGRLAHMGNLGGEVGGWRKLAENVGTGASADEVHATFMGSAMHRNNILDPAFAEVGVGVAWRDGRIWVSEVFRAPAGAPPPPPPPPPAPPPPPRPAPVRASRTVQRAAPPTTAAVPPPGLFAPPPTPPPGLFAPVTTTSTTSTISVPRPPAHASLSEARAATTGPDRLLTRVLGLLVTATVLGRVGRRHRAVLRRR